MKWEYRKELFHINSLTKSIKLDEAIASMNKLGAEGWELVLLREDPVLLYGVFKRPIPG